MLGTNPATIASPNAIGPSFAESQQAGLTAMISLAEAPAPPRPLPQAVLRPPQAEPPASPRSAAANAIPARPVAVIAQASAEIGPRLLCARPR